MEQFNHKDNKNLEDAKKKLSDHYHYIDYLQQKIKHTYNTLCAELPSFEEEVRVAHESRAMELAKKTVVKLTSGMTASMTSSAALNQMRPIPPHEFIHALDTLIIDLKRMVIFGLSTVSLAAGFGHDSNLSLTKFLNHCDPALQQGGQKSKLVAFLFTDPKAKPLADFVCNNIAQLRALNNQRTSLEHIDLYYAGVHHLELVWPQVEEASSSPVPVVNKALFTRKGKQFLDQIADEVQLAIDIRNACGKLGKELEGTDQ